MAPVLSMTVFWVWALGGFRWRARILVRIKVQLSSASPRSPSRGPYGSVACTAAGPRATAGAVSGV